jgi:hypothetical protein
MTLCAYCGAETSSHGLCSYHPSAHGDDWARSNRVMCDFVHRGVVPAAAPEPLDVELETLEWAA